MNISDKAGWALAIFAASLAVPASAYPNGLTLGKKGTSLSGAAILSPTGTLAGGAYQYDDANNLPVALDPTQNSFDALFAYGNSSVTINGGSLYSLVAHDNSTATVSGGTINGLSAADSSTINVTAVPKQTLGAAFLFGTVGAGTIDFFGTGFTTAPTVDANQFTIRGTLLDGNNFVGTYFDNGGRLLFNGVPAAVPEASSVVSFGVLLAFGLGGMVVAARRKKSAP